MHEAHAFLRHEGHTIADATKPGDLDSAGERLLEEVSQRLQSQPPLTLVQKLDIVTQLLTGLHYAHEQGIVHRDVKPANIMINENGAVKITDFGIAKALSLTRKLTRNDFGSVAYASPERLESGEVDIHSDLWSVGVVLYELLVGRQPYQEVNTRRLEEVIRSRQTPPALPASCPPGLQRVVARALAPQLSQRSTGRVSSSFPSRISSATSSTTRTISKS